MVIFTDCQADGAAGAAEAREYEAAARRAGRLFVPVYMTCGLHENLRRMRSAEHNGGGGSGSNTSGVGGGGDGATPPALYRFPDREGLDIDVTHQPTHETAIRILSFVRALSATEEAADEEREQEEEEAPTLSWPQPTTRPPLPTAASPSGSILALSERGCWPLEESGALVQSTWLPPTSSAWLGLAWLGLAWPRSTARERTWKRRLGMPSPLSPSHRPSSSQSVRL